MIEEKSLFLHVFGDHPKLRILDFLITFSDFDYAMKEIAQKSGVGYSTLRALWPELITEKIVIQTRTIGKAKLYQLNTDNQLVKSFERFYWEVTKHLTQQRHPEFKKIKKIVI